MILKISFMRILQNNLNKPLARTKEKMPIQSLIKELPLPCVKLADLQRFPDERGVLIEIFRND